MKAKISGQNTGCKIQLFFERIGMITDIQQSESQTVMEEVHVRTISGTKNKFIVTHSVKDDIIPEGIQY